VVATQNFQGIFVFGFRQEWTQFCATSLDLQLQIHKYIKFNSKFITDRIVTYLVVISDKHISCFRPLLAQCMYFIVAGYYCVCELNKSVVKLNSVN
jgi:hypothetical protein